MVTTTSSSLSIAKQCTRRQVPTYCGEVFEIKKGDSSSASSERRPSVTFGQVEVREYGLTLGDNPSCSNGPPLTLDWSYHNMVYLPLTDEPEGCFGNIRHKDCKNKNKMGISEQRRIELLLELGHTHEEIMQAELMKLKHQLLRQRTLGNLKSAQKESIKLLFDRVHKKYAARKARHSDKTI
uniref:Uncharacterized protein n=1 Tax=Ditylum brightwellii TaxID=49249 RepID=A0A7S2EIZ4_9STRA|mmetsp:Transcript_32325/g.48220  ORF Transcript_32325/g.48220 Transcript_32325/m.48220 type:complete len:182 (+) Transcript_32325:174-719(+)